MRGSENEARPREGFKIGQQRERTAKRRRREMKGQDKVSCLILRKPKRERQEYEMAQRQS